MAPHLALNSQETLPYFDKRVTVFPGCGYHRPFPVRCREFVMAVLRRSLLLVVMSFLMLGSVAHTPAHAQGDPVAQQKAYTAILANPDATRRAEALEMFIAYYPASPLVPGA